jgi:hypothetical protein
MVGVPVVVRLRQSEKPLYKKCRSKYRNRLYEASISSKSSIYRLVNKIRTAGSILQRALQQTVRVLLEQTLDNIGAAQKHCH